MCDVSLLQSNYSADSVAVTAMTKQVFVKTGFYKVREREEAGERREGRKREEKVKWTHWKKFSFISLSNV